MPIRREHRHFYSIDWPQLSAMIRFVRARSQCEGCGRPHMQDVQHILAMDVGGMQSARAGVTGKAALYIVGCQCRQRCRSA